MSFSRHALADESAHLATTALALEVAGIEDGGFIATALASSVMIDADHIPQALLGLAGVRRAWPRPPTHSLASVAAVSAASLSAPPSRRQTLRAVTFGLCAHLLRDLTDGSAGVPLLWPLRRRSVRVPWRIQPALLLAALLWLNRDALRGLRRAARHSEGPEERR